MFTRKMCIVFLIFSFTNDIFAGSLFEFKDEPVDAYDVISLNKNLKKAAQGDTDAQFQVGEQYDSNGEYDKSVSWYAGAAKKNHAAAQYKLGLAYEKGLGSLHKDKKLALEWYLKAAQQGNNDALLKLDDFHIPGVDVEKMKKAAQDDADSLFQGAEQYNSKGEYDKSVSWYAEAAKKNHAAAQYKLGLAYEKGLGSLHKDKKLALEWYLKAAQQGNNDALLKLNGSDFLTIPAIIHYRNKISSSPQQKISSINSIIEDAVQKFVTVPLVPEPSLPPTPTLVKDEFEKEAQFKERVLLEINKREAQVTAIQAAYRTDVVARNERFEQRMNFKDKYGDYIAKIYFEQIMGGVYLQNAKYDPEKEIMYVDLVSTNSDFTRPIAIPIPLANDEAKNIKRQIESGEPSLDVKAIFSVDKSNIALNEVQLTANGRSYLSQLQSEKFSPKIVQITLPQTQAQVDALYQNPNLADLIQIPKLSFADRAFNGNVQFIDDVADGVKQLAETPKDAKKWLFLVAVEDYKETDKVIFAKHSADLLATALKKRLGISDRNAYVLIDADATAGAIKDKLAQMVANIKPDDTVYFYYSGHGVPDPVSAESYILPRDKVVDFVVKEPDFQLSHIYRTLSQSAAGKVVAFVDSCFSGRTDNMSIIKGTAPGLIRVKDVDIQGQNMAVITAGKNTQFSNAYDAKGHRMFSYFLIRSLIKERNTPLDINTIFQEVSVGVRDASSAKGDIYKQEPQVYGNSSLPL